MKNTQHTQQSTATAAQPQHTPGPWQLEQPGFNSISHVSYVAGPSLKANGGTLTAICLGPDQAANSRLIAAAPELLATCEAIAQLLGDDDLPDNGELSGAAITEQLRAVIAKATGNTP